MPAESYFGRLEMIEHGFGQKSVADGLFGSRGTASQQQWSGDIAPRCDVLRQEVCDPSQCLVHVIPEDSRTTRTSRANGPWEEHSKPTNAKTLYLDVSLGQTRVPFVGHVSCVRLRLSAARLFDRVRMIHVGRRSYCSSPRPRAGPHHWVRRLAIKICQGQSAQSGSCSSSGPSAPGVGKGDNREHEA